MECGDYKMGNQSPKWSIWAEVACIGFASASLYQGMLVGDWEVAGLLLVGSLCAVAVAIRGNSL